MIRAQHDPSIAGSGSEFKCGFSAIKNIDVSSLLIENVELQKRRLPRMPPGHAASEPSTAMPNAPRSGTEGSVIAGITFAGGSCHERVADMGLVHHVIPLAIHKHGCTGPDRSASA